MDDKRKIIFWGMLCCGILALMSLSASAFGQNVSPAGNLEGAMKDYAQLGTGSANALLGDLGIPQINDLNFAKIVAYLLFGAIGFIAFSYGKKTANWRVLAIGIALMGYPYFVSTTEMIYIIGAILTAMLYAWRG